MKKKSYLVCIKRMGKYDIALIKCTCGRFHLCKIKNKNTDTLEILETFEKVSLGKKAFDKIR